MPNCFKSHENDMIIDGIIKKHVQKLTKIHVIPDNINMQKNVEVKINTNLQVIIQQFQELSEELLQAVANATSLDQFNSLEQTNLHISDCAEYTEDTEE